MDLTFDSFPDPSLIKPYWNIPTFATYTLLSSGDKQIPKGYRPTATDRLNIFVSVSRMTILKPI